MSKEINVYWAPFITINQNGGDWSLLYPKPITLFNDLLNTKSKNKTNNSFFACPAFADKTKKILVFKNPEDMEYEYDFSNGNQSINPKSDFFITIQNAREDAISPGPLLSIKLEYVFFSDEPLDAYFTPPFFNPPGYTKYASVIPGEFNIGKWFRPYNFEIQTWSPKGNIIFKKNEPLFYVELKTDKKINLHRFDCTDKLIAIGAASANSGSIFGRGKSLISRYNRFTDVGLREKVLTEIKKNIIKEDKNEN